MSKLSHQHRLMTERRLANQDRTPTPAPAPTMARASQALPQLTGRTGRERRAELRRLRTACAQGDQR